MVGSGRGAQLGIVVKGPEVLEQTRRIGTIVLDKTGTVTEGRIELVEVTPLDGASRTEILRLAGAVESASEHPIARAVADAARLELGELPPVTEFRNLPGTGVHGVADGHARGDRPEQRVDHGHVGRRDSRAAERARHPQADEPRGGRRPRASRPHAGTPHGRRPRGGRARRAGGGDRPRRRRGPSRRTRSRRCAGSRRTARSWRWSGTA